MSDVNELQVSWQKEASFGNPNSGANFQEFGIVSGSMNRGKQSTRSNMVRSDAQRAASIALGIQPNVSYDFELAAVALDDLVEGMIRASSSWSTAVAIAATDIVAVASGNKYTSTTTDFTAQNISLYQPIYVDGFATAANNGWRWVTAILAGEITVTGGMLVDEAAGPSVTMKGQQIRNGTGKPSYAWQHHHQDLANKWHRLIGGRFASLSLDFQSESIITGSFQLDGKNMTQETANAGTGIDAIPATEVMAEVDSFGSVWRDYVPMADDILAVTFNGVTPTRRSKGLGQPTSGQINLGALAVSLGLQLYQDNSTWSVEADYHSDTKFALAWDLVDAAGNRYLYEVPQAEITDEPGQIQGVDTDKLYDFSLECEPGGSMAKTIQIARVLA